MRTLFSSYGSVPAEFSFHELLQFENMEVCANIVLSVCCTYVFQISVYVQYVCISNDSLSQILTFFSVICQPKFFMNFPLVVNTVNDKYH